MLVTRSISTLPAYTGLDSRPFLRFLDVDWVISFPERPKIYAVVVVTPIVSASKDVVVRDTRGV